MSFLDVILTAAAQLRVNPLRAFFTLLGIIVSVAFLVAVVAIIQGMNAYVQENIAGAVIGALVLGALNIGMGLMGIGIDYQFSIKALVLLGAVYVDVRGKNRDT